MSVPVLLPELGESVVEATVAKWLVKEGEAVERDQPLVEVTTDKVDAEIPAPDAGVVVQILVAEGETIPVGTELAKIDAAAGATASAASADPEAAVAPAPPAAAPGGAAPKATPVAARVAADRGVELSEVRGTGVSGRITRDDVERAADASEPAATPKPAAPPPSAPAAPASSAPAARSAGPPDSAPDLSGAKARFGYYAIQEGDRVVPMSPLRKIVAEHMVYSKHTSPHVGTVAEVDMGGVAALRARAKGAFKEAHGFGLTFLPFIVHATVRALREFPVLNASVIEDAIVEKRDIHIGIAVETEKGLVVPVVRNADRLSMAGLAAEIEDLSSRARSKKLSADDLQGGTFTVSNPGRQGNLYGFAIINQPQVGILRMGEMVKRPVVRAVDGADAIVIRPMMHLALSYDHRAVDGAPANGFLYRVREILEEADFDL
ncbi:MAG: dihydrolipoyllysine acetyltransferase [Deltaproteobacteria bacterium]|jgi:2-oxoglutarate dehydrogenase E2 component (dihydrolipoamide succinyltransferase)|nr:dihydrolipoyllysine acetyltransferase [Deltaproteobacteria bacterium]